MFSDRIAQRVVKIAGDNGIPKAAMLAIVEVETGGSPTEADGRTPNFLFERHIFYRELKARRPELLNAAVRAGLAIPKWSKATQYRDERTSAQRMSLLAKAKAIDEECALRSASWGLPQLMGNECREVGFPSAVAMVEHLTTGGVDAHLDLMVRFLKARKLVSAMERGDWAYVALRYNGAGYRANKYDTRLADAERRWKRKVAELDYAEGDGNGSVTPPRWPEEGLSRDEIFALQGKLRELGYHGVGRPDGVWGANTVGAISAFQHHEKLAVTGHYDADTKEAMSSALPKPVSQERENTTVNDLREAGSKTVSDADTGAAVGVAKIGAGGIITAAGAMGSDLLDTAQTATEKADQVKTVWQSIHDIASPAAHPVVFFVGIALVIGGIVAFYYFNRVRQRRLEDEQNGIHPGHFEG